MGIQNWELSNIWKSCILVLYEKKGGIALANEKIKNHAKSNHVRLWEVAEKLHIQDSAFSRKLRKELPEEEQSAILEIIDIIAMAKGEC